MKLLISSSNLMKLKLKIAISWWNRIDYQFLIVSVSNLSLPNKWSFIQDHFVAILSVECKMRICLRESQNPWTTFIF